MSNHSIMPNTKRIGTKTGLRARAVIILIVFIFCCLTSMLYGCQGSNNLLDLSGTYTCERDGNALNYGREITFDSNGNAEYSAPGYTLYGTYRKGFDKYTVTFDEVSGVMADLMAGLGEVKMTLKPLGEDSLEIEIKGLAGSAEIGSNPAIFSKK